MTYREWLDGFHAGPSFVPFQASVWESGVPQRAEFRYNMQFTNPMGSESDTESRYRAIPYGKRRRGGARIEPTPGYGANGGEGFRPATYVLLPDAEKRQRVHPA